MIFKDNCYRNELINKWLNSRLQWSIDSKSIVTRINILFIIKITFNDTIQEWFNTTTIINQSSKEYMCVLKTSSQEIKIFFKVHSTASFPFWRGSYIWTILSINTFGSSIRAIHLCVFFKIISLILPTLLLNNRFWAAILQPIHKLYSDDLPINVAALIITAIAVYLLQMYCLLITSSSSFSSVNSYTSYSIIISNMITIILIRVGRPFDCITFIHNPIDNMKKLSLLQQSVH